MLVCSHSAIELATIQTKSTFSGLTDKGDIKAVLCESMQKLGLFLLIVSFLPWLAVFFVVPFLPLDITQKTTLSVVLAVGAEVCFWISVVLLGKEVVTKYRRYLHPQFLWKKLKNFKRR
ncbi:transporter suffix domain-containing protein [Microcoleus sp. S13_C5]|uniref:transporter suffix domain-containing protein n=1 Tax=Microcoleus sp. S13_C5 TaxID=3055411 RepID=UPI002FD74C0B